MRMLHMRSLMRRPSSPKAGWIMSLRLSLILMLRSLRSGMTRRMVIGSPPLSATRSATKLLAAASGSGEFFPSLC